MSCVCIYSYITGWLGEIQEDIHTLEKQLSFCVISHCAFLILDASICWLEFAYVKVQNDHHRPECIKRMSISTQNIIKLLCRLTKLNRHVFNLEASVPHSQLVLYYLRYAKYHVISHVSHCHPYNLSMCLCSHGDNTQLNHMNWLL